jgi:hypothetical protein
MHLTKGIVLIPQDSLQLSDFGRELFALQVVQSDFRSK